MRPLRPKGAVRSGDRRTEARTRALSLLDARGRRWLSRWNRTSSPYPLGETIPGLFESQARRTPHRVALVSGSRTLTYGELDRRANGVASELADRGVGSEVVVAICAERSLEMLIGVLGILKAGGACLPLDPQESVERLRAILLDAAPGFCLAQARFEGLLAGTPCEALELDALCADGRARSSSNSERAGDATGLAYVLCTSQAAGGPKAISVVHRGVVRLVRGIGYARLDADQTILQQAPLGSVASAFEIWGALLNGGCVALAPPGPLSPGEIGDAIRRHDATTVYVTAELSSLLLDNGLASLAPVKQLLVETDALTVSRARRLLDELPHCRLINMYGKTEATAFAASHSVRAVAAEARTLPIGRPISNTRIYLMDALQRCVPPGNTGEICIAGDGLARGYPNDPVRTAEKFLPDLFSDLHGARLYRTGDFGRIGPAGELELIGAADRRVKVSVRRPIAPSASRAGFSRAASE